MGFLTSLKPLILTEGRLRIESFSTFLTVIWILACVIALLCAILWLQIKCFQTYFTFIGFCPSVDFLMNLQFCFNQFFICCMAVDFNLPEMSAIIFLDGINQATHFVDTFTQNLVTLFASNIFCNRRLEFRE